MSVSRLRLKDVLQSRFASEIGLDDGDVPRIAEAVNSIQERLITCKEAGDTGWLGSYAEMAFNVSQTSPNLTTPRGVARLIRVNACDWPVRIENQFFEYLEFGSGHWPKLSCGSTSNVCASGPFKALRRNTVPTFTDLTVPGYGLRFYPGDPADVNLRDLVGCNDAFVSTIYTMDGPVQVRGVFTTLSLPSVNLTLPGTTSPLEISSINSIQKDITVGSLNIYQVNLSTGAQTLLLTMEPGETVAAYQRYYFNALPNSCCNPPGTAPGTVQLLAMAKLDLVPCVVDSDFLLIQSKEAIIAEGQAMRLGSMDSGEAKQQAAERHREAIRYLNGQLVHYEGKEQPAVLFRPFGSARLRNQRIGSLI